MFLGTVNGMDCFISEYNDYPACGHGDDVKYLFCNDGSGRGGFFFAMSSESLTARKSNYRREELNEHLRVITKDSPNCSKNSSDRHSMSLALMLNWDCDNHCIREDLITKLP